MTEYKELKEKIAKWLGFTLVDTQFYSHSFGESEVETWTAPDGHTCHCPDFLKSLDTCFKHFMPKLRYANIQFVDRYSGIGPQFSATVSNQFANNYTWSDNIPQIALCRAVEQMIDMEVR